MWTPAALFLLLISVLFFTIFFYNDLQVLDIEDYLRAKKQVTVVPETAAMPQVVQELISEFKMIASDVENNVSEDWKQQNECKSRQSLERLYEQRKYAGGVSMKNHNWEKVFEEYSNLHSRCMKKIGNLTQYFHSQNNSISDCKFIITAAGNGLGNKVLFFISSVFYGILTKRVVLIPATTNIPAIMCEPFVGSSWKLDDNSVLTSKIWTKREDIIGAMDQAAKNSTRLTSHYAAVLTNDWQPDGRVYCSTGQELLKDVPWLKFGGCLYFLPKIFTIPEFRPLLEAMFPDKMALTYLLRSVMLPANSVWERVERINDLYIRNADRFVGMQVRYRGEASHFKDMNRLINSRVTACAWANRLMPRALNSTASRRKEISHKPITNIFIASLFPGLRDHLNHIYMQNPTENGELVGIIQLTEEGYQARGEEVDRQALTEIIILSLADNLFVTPLSTFGGLAQGYGALLPWFINFGKNESEAACFRAQSVDVCFQRGSGRYSCPFDKERDHVIFDTFPYMKSCMSIEGGGLQLLSSIWRA